jgi:hypothetical protein
MRKFNLVAAQGDIYLRKIDALPPNVTKIDPAAGKHVVAHSETGHNHVIDVDGVTMYRLPDSIYDCFLVVDKPQSLTHLRPFDTHEPIMLDSGIYHVRRQREYVPEGFRRVED